MIVYGSWILLIVEKNYCVICKEMLVFVFFVKYFKYYLFGCEFILRMDYGLLVWFYKFKDLDE